MDRKGASEALHQFSFDPRFVAAGMEGFVFDIGDALLAKVWTKKGFGEVEQLRSFYTQLREKHLPFVTPQIREVLETLHGSVVSIEERLPGITLKHALERDPKNGMLAQKGMDTIFSVVEALRAAGDVPAARELALLNESSLWTPHSTWGWALAAFVKLRVNKHKRLLQHAVVDLEHKVHRVVVLLEALNVTRLGVIHGDLCPENVLVDDSTLTPTGLLDFGFLTTSADPLFDAVISTLLFDMYSPRSHEARESLRARYSQHLGQPFREVYPLYKAAYALATSNAYSEDGEEGHFRWCVAILNDEETNVIAS